MFRQVQAQKQQEDDEFEPLNIACVFSPPAEGNKDVKQLQEDLPTEKADNKEKPNEKKAALKEIIAGYNAQYDTNHDINNFDLYYQDVQQRIKDHQYPDKDLPHAQKIDLTIVVDMLLTGFDSKFLNTLYVDKNLKYHGLIQAFSRTNRVLNDTKPYGNIIDFRQQEEAVDEAITLFSGKGTGKKPREIWLVDAAPEVVEKFEQAVGDLREFMQTQGVDYAPEEVVNLKGDTRKSQFVTLFKEVQRLKTQLDQYTDLTAEAEETIEQVMPQDQLQAFRGVYLDEARRLKDKQEKQGEQAEPEVQELDFEFVLFASAVIDYDYIMKLLANYSQAQPGRERMSREELIGLIQSDAKFMDQREEIEAYIKTLEVGKGLSEDEIRSGYEAFRERKSRDELAELAAKHGLATEALRAFVDEILRRMIFDGERLSDLMAPLGLGWKARTKKELALMEDLIPLLKKLAEGREISGLKAYE